MSEYDYTTDDGQLADALSDGELEAVNAAFQGDSAEAGAAEPGAGTPTASDAPAAGEAAPAPADAPEWAQQMVAGYQQQAQEIAQLRYDLGQAMYPQQQEPEIEYDPDNPDSLRALIEQGSQQALAPVMPLLQEIQQERQQARINEWISAAATTHGDFDNAERDAIARFSLTLLPAFGGNGQLAVSEAAKTVGALRNTWKQKGRDDYVAEAQARLGAPRIPGGGAQVASVVPEAKDELEAARMFVDEVRLSRAS